MCDFIVDKGIPKLLSDISFTLLGISLAVIAIIYSFMSSKYLEDDLDPTIPFRLIKLQNNMVQVIKKIKIIGLVFCISGMISLGWFILISYRVPSNILTIFAIFSIGSFSLNIVSLFFTILKLPTHLLRRKNG